jgi:hypothetical protein
MPEAAIKVLYCSGAKKGGNSGTSFIYRVTGKVPLDFNPVSQGTAS